MDDGKGDAPAPQGGPQVHDYEELLAAASPVAFRVDDENRAAAMAYTSGTTGNPQGVVYSHRSTFLHTLGTMVAGGLGAQESDRSPRSEARRVGIEGVSTCRSRWSPHNS